MPPGYAVDDGVALIFRGTELAEVVAARPAAHAYAVTATGGAPLDARQIATPAASRATLPAVAEMRRLRLARLRINQQFRLLFAGQGVSVVGDALFPVALAFAVLDDLDGTPAQLGIVLAAQTVPMAVLILASGVWADRLNRRNVMIISDLGRAAVQATLAILLISGTAELWQMIVLVAIYGTFEAGFAPAAGGLVPDVAGREHLQQANAMLGLARNTGMVLGPTLAGLLIFVAGPGTAIAIDAATFLVSVAFLAHGFTSINTGRRPPSTISGATSSRASTRSAGGAGCGRSCPRSRPTTCSRCRACWRSGP